MSLVNGKAGSCQASTAGNRRQVGPAPPSSARKTPPEEMQWTSAGAEIKIASNQPAIRRFQKDPVMELKVVCQCGQKFKFDVEPVSGRMPFTVKCPVCNEDGTVAANALLASQFAATSPGVPPPPIAPAATGVRINRAAPETAAPAVMAPMRVTVPPPISAMRPGLATKKSPPAEAGEFSLVRGILGAVAGAGVGCGLMVAFWLWAHFRFPLMGIAVGATAGYGARWLARGTENTLGVITAAIACLSVTGTYVLMYGEFALFSIISIVICTGIAYRASSE
jgi:hypothetical protein